MADQFDNDDLNRVRNVLARVKCRGFQFSAAQPPGKLPYLQAFFWAPNAEAPGGFGIWGGRKLLLSPHMTDGEIVQTALKAVLTAIEHEARESFLYRGQPVFGEAAREQFKNVGAADEDGLYGYGGGEWEEKCDEAWRTVAKMVEMLAEGSEPGPVMKYGQDALDRDE